MNRAGLGSTIVTHATPGDGAPVTAPLPTSAQSGGYRGALSLFTGFNYRVYVLSVLCTSTGMWMARIAIDWLVLELTGNLALVGLTVACQFGPSLILGPWAGIISDRYRRRSTLIATSAVQAGAVAVLAVLVLTDTVVVGQVFAAALVTGVAAAIDAPSRSAFIAEVVGTDRLPAAISLNGLNFHLGGLIGPAISGVLIAAIGSGWAIGINAVLALGALALLLVIRAGELRTAPRTPRSRGQIREALRYAGSKPTILWPLVLLGFVATFGMTLPVLFTAAASDHGYGTGAAGYGLYSSLAAVGACTGAIIAAGRVRLRLRALVTSVVVYGAITVFCGVAPASWLFAVGLVAIGISRLGFAAANEATVQLSAHPGIRGRVMSCYYMTLTGGQALGGILVGWIAEEAGVTPAFLVAGGVPAIAAIVVGLVLARRRQLRVRVDVRHPRRLVTIARREQILAES